MIQATGRDEEGYRTYTVEGLNHLHLMALLMLLNMQTGLSMPEAEVKGKLEPVLAQALNDLRLGE